MRDGPIPQLAALLGAALVLFPPSPHASGEAPSVEERAGVSLVRLPVLLDEKNPGACSTIDASNIEVTEDGLDVGPVYLEQTPLESVHAIVIDTGPSMLSNLDIARKVTAAHVAALPEREPVLLATVDDSLLLHSPLSTDRGRFTQGLEWIEIGDQTFLWDGMRQLVRYLRPRPERKVVLLLTEGCDTQKVAAVSAASTIEEAGRSGSVVVFTVGIGLPAHCPGTDLDPAGPLRDLAQVTGGEFHSVNRVQELEEVLSRIRHRLDRERVLQYEPLPFGDGARDRPEQFDHRYRKLDLDLRETPGCQVRLAGPRTRFVSSSRGLFHAGSVPSGFEGLSFKDVEDGRLEARVLDVVHDGGAPPNLIGLGRQGGPSDRPRRTAERSVVALIPSLANVVRPDATPESPLFTALDAVARAPLGSRAPLVDGEWAAWTDVPLLVNGRTLLAARRALSDALANHPEYGRWAFGRIRESRISQLNVLIDQAATPDRRIALEAARESLKGHSWTPEPEELERYLGAWLGDVRAPLMFNAAETWLARRVMSAAAGDHLDRLEAAAAESERLWTVLKQWFPPGRDVRAIGVLVPAYDPERDVVGYYRVTLKQSTAFAINEAISGIDPTRFVRPQTERAGGTLYARLKSWNYSRDAPLGVRMIRWMLEQELVRPVLERLTLASIRYDTPTNRDLHGVLSELGMVSPREGTLSYPARQVTLILTDRQDPDQRFEVHAYFPTLPDDSNTYAEAPGCLVLPDVPPDKGLGFELFGSLFAAKKHSNFPCVFQAGAATAVTDPPGG